MSLSCTIANVSVDVQSISRPDPIDQKTICTITVLDSVGTAFYQRGMPVTITDSILGSIFTGYVHSPKMVPLYPNVNKLWTIDCVQRGDYLANKRTSNKTYANQFAGTIAVDQVQRNGATEGLSANAALRWDELETDWQAGTLTNTLATTNATDGNPGDGDLELALAGSQVAVSNSGAGFSLGAGLLFTGYASSGYTNAYNYRGIWSGSQAISNGQADYLTYDVWVSSTSPQIMSAVDFGCSDFSALRASGAVDLQGMSAHSNTDLSGLANDQWYSRVIYMPSSLNAKTITNFNVVFEGDNAGMYTSYFRNIVYHYNSGTIGSPAYVALNIFTSTLQINVQTSNNGYSNVNLTQVQVEDKSHVSVRGPLSIGAAGIVRNSQITFSSLIPTGCTGVAETSIDNQASWQVVTSGASIPNLLAGMSVASRSVYVRFTFSVGADPTANMGFGAPTIIINSAYNATKSDVISTYTTATNFNTGTLTDLKTVGSTSTPAITTNGFTRNWDNADYSSQTAFSSSSGTSAVVNKQFQLSTATGGDMRSRFDFVGTWQNFIAEIDVRYDANIQVGLEYRTTSWSNGANSFAYVVMLYSGQIQLGHGTNGGGSTFTPLATATISLTDQTLHRLKVDVSGSSHSAYLDNVPLISFTDATYSAAGNIGVRCFNGSGSTRIGLFDNFGVCSALSGTWQSPSIALSSATTYGNSVVQWDVDGIPDSTCSITAQTSINAGSTWQAATNGGPISGLTAGSSLSGVNLLLKLTLTASNAPVVPILNGVTAWVMGQYSASGTRISPSLSLTGITNASTTLVNWNANLPTNTNLVVASSINGGSTWQTVAAAGNAITGIALQSTPIEDIFAVNSSANYTQGNFGGGTGTWVWDTAHSRLTGSGGTNGALAYTTALTGADNQLIADFDQADGSGLLTNYTATSSGYYVQIWDASAGGTPNTAKLFRRSGSTNAQVGSTATISFVRGTIKRFMLNVQAGVLTVSMDGASIITYTDGSPLGAGQSGLLLNTLARVYSLRILQYGQNVSALSLLTKCTLTSTDPTVTPQLLDLQAFVSGPDIGPGSLVPAVAYQGTFLDANIADLNTKSNYWTYFRNDGSLIFQARTATPAPFVLSSLNSQTIAGQTINDVLVNGAEVDNSGDSYRNRMTMLGAIATSVYPEIRSGDGQTQTWNVSHPLAAPPASIILNGQTQTFGMKNVDSGKNFYYQIGSVAIDQDSSGTVLQETDSFIITYTGSSVQNVTLDNTSLPGTITQSQMAAIENSAGGSSSGIVEAVLDVSGTPTTVAAATAQGNQLLQRYGNIGRTTILNTLRSGLLPGMQLALFVSECNLNNVQVLITSIDVTITQAPGVTGGLLYAWKITAQEGPALGTWVRLFTNGLGGG
jgi:hypothetical protein